MLKMLLRLFGHQKTILEDRPIIKEPAWRAGKHCWRDGLVYVREEKGQWFALITDPGYRLYMTSGPWSSWDEAEEKILDATRKLF